VLIVSSTLQAEYTAMDDVTDSSKMSTNTRPSAANTPGAELQDVIKLLDLSSTAGPLAQLKGRKPMAEISIPGMSTIFGDASVCRRVVWCFFMVVCITIATIQVLSSSTREMVHQQRSLFDFEHLAHFWLIVNLMV